MRAKLEAGQGAIMIIFISFCIYELWADSVHRFKLTENLSNIYANMKIDAVKVHKELTYLE